MPKHDPVSSAVAGVLRDLREAQEISQEKLAFAADLDRTYIGMIEREERYPRVPALGAILKALGISWAEFGAAVDKAQRSRKRR